MPPLVGLLRNPDEIGYAFHWAGIQLGRHDGNGQVNLQASGTRRQAVDFNLN